MKVVILCGGKGTRLREETEFRPKPMVPIGSRPILWHIMKIYAAHGFNEFILCLGYKGQMIKDFFIHYDTRLQDCTVTLGTAKGIQYHSRHEEIDWTVTLAETGLESLTGTRLRLVQKYLAGPEDFMLTYGDGVSDVDLDALLKFHRSHGKIMTVTGVRPPGRFGELLCDAAGRVTEFNEKPQATVGQISGGFFVCRPEILRYLDPQANQMLEVEPMRQLVQEGQLMVFPHKGFWYPMDTYRDYTLLNSLVAKRQAPWIIWK